MNRILWLLLFPLCILAQPPVEQAVSEPVSESESQPTPSGFDSLGDELTALNALNDSILSREQERDELFQQLQAAIDPIQRDALLPRIKELNQEIAEYNHAFQKMALKTDISLFIDKPKEEFNWQQKAYEIAEPLFDKLEEMTKESRELTALKKNLETNQQRKQVSEEALQNLDILLAGTPTPELQTRFTQLKGEWQDRLQNAENAITTYEFQLKQIEDARQSIVEEGGKAAKNFIRTLGLDLPLGILAFCGVFFGMK